MIPNRHAFPGQWLLSHCPGKAQSQTISQIEKSKAYKVRSRGNKTYIWKFKVENFFHQSYAFTGQSTTQEAHIPYQSCASLAFAEQNTRLVY